MSALTQTEALALSEQSAQELNAIIERDAQASAEARSRAAAGILAGMKRLKPKAKGPSGQKLLKQVRN
jgi:hypothetical protein